MSKRRGMMDRYDELRVRSVRLSELHERIARRIGAGSMSEGIRKALEKAGKEKYE